MYSITSNNSPGEFILFEMIKKGDSYSRDGYLLFRAHKFTLSIQFGISHDGANGIGAWQQRIRAPEQVEIKA